MLNLTYLTAENVRSAYNCWSAANTDRRSNRSVDKVFCLQQLQMPTPTTGDAICVYSSLVFWRRTL